jgi:pimeloyl-ACP methyl ester carboxylesterase
MDVVQHTYTVNGVDLNVEIAGEGPTVLLVHGFPDDHTVWRHQVPVLVEAGYRVIAPDTRGCGQSDAPVGTKHYALDLLVADLVALLDALGIERVRLVGHDWGAVIGWQFAIRHPERVERYVALSVGHPAAYARAPLEQKLKGWYVLFFLIPGLPERLLRLGGWRLFAALTHGEDEVPRWVEKLSRPGRLTAAINYYRANIARLLRPGSDPVVVPVTGVWSTGDRFLTEAQMVDSERYVKASWRYERIDGAGHWLQLDAPAQLNPLLLTLLR